MYSVCVPWICKPIITCCLELPLLIGLNKLMLKGMGQKRVTDSTLCFLNCAKWELSVFLPQSIGFLAFHDNVTQPGLCSNLIFSLKKKNHRSRACARNVGSLNTIIQIVLIFFGNVLPELACLHLQKTSFCPVKSLRKSKGVKNMQEKGIHTHVPLEVSLVPLCGL